MPARRQPTVDKDRPSKNRRPAFRLGRLIAALFLIALLLLSAGVFFHRALLRAYAPTILETLAEEFEAYYELELTWNGYSIEGLNDFTIAGVTIRDIPTDTPLLTLDSIRVRTSLFAVAIRGKNPMGAVTSVELNHPVITLGKEEGRWNTGKLLEPGEGEAFEFPGRLGILVNDGTIDWLGGEIETGYPFPPSRISGLQGIFRLGANGGMGFSFDGVFSSGEIEPASIDVTGTFDPDTYMMHINSTVQAFDLSSLRSLLEQYEINAIDGMVDAEISILVGPEAGDTGFSVLGQATMSGGAIETEMLDLPVRDASGVIHFSHESVFTSGLSADVDGASVTARGRLADFAAESISADLIVEAEGIQASTMQRLAPEMTGIPVDGSLNGRAEVEISGDEISAFLSANSSGISVMGIQSGIDEVFAWYSDDKLVLNNARINVYGGTIAGGGTVDMSSDELMYDFSLSATGIPVEELTDSLPTETANNYMPTGILSGDVEISGQGLSTPLMIGVIRTRGMRVPAYPDLPPATAVVPIEISGDEIHIRGMDARLEGATLLCEGTYRIGGGFNGTIAITIEEKNLIKNATGMPVEGEFALAGDIAYSPGESPTFGGEVFLTDGIFGTLNVPNLSARIDAIEGGIVISELSGLMSGGEIHGDLTVPISNGGAARDTGSFVISSFDISQLLPEGQSSLIATSLEMTADVEYIRDTRTLNFDMNVKDDAARLGPNNMSTTDDGIDFRIVIPLQDMVSAHVIASGMLEITPASAPVYRGRILTPYSAQVVREITDLLTGRIIEIYGEASTAIPAVNGIFTVNADFFDLLGNVSGSVNISTGPTQIAGNDLESTMLAFTSGDGITWNLDMDIDAGETGRFELSGNLERAELLSESTLDLSANIIDSGLRKVVGFAGLSELGRTSGTINASGGITGTLREPVIDSFIVTMGESEAFGIPLESASAGFSYSAPMVQLTSLEIAGRDGFRLLGAGAIDISAPSITNASLVMRVDQFDLQVISRAIESEFPLAGIASATVQLAQDALGPKILYDAGIDELGWQTQNENVPMGRLTLQAESRPGEEQIQIRSLRLARNGETMNLSGLVPSSLTDAGAELFDLTLVSETGYNPTMPEGVIEGVAWEGGLGPVNLAWTGSAIAPNIYGDISVGIRNISYMDSVIVQSIEGTLYAENSVIIASPESVRVTGEGWQLGVDGRINIDNMMKRIHTGMDLSLVQVSEQPVRISGPGFAFAIALGTDDRAPRFVLSYNSLEPSALLSSDFSIMGGQVDIARLPLEEDNDGSTQQQSATEEPEARSNLTFDINVLIGAGIRVQNGNMMNAVFETGELNLAGPLDNIVLAGSINAPTGWIDLFGNHFVLTEPLECIFTTFTPLTDPLVKATAQTHMREVQSPGMYGEELTVTARIDSRLSNMIENLQLTSDPPLNRDQIIAALAYEDVIFRTFGNYVLGDGTPSAGFSDTDLTGMALPFATSYLSRYIRREAGFTDFEISFDRDQNILIYLEKEVFNNVVMFYRQRFGPDTQDEYEWGSRYRWRPRSWVGFEVDNDEDITGLVEYIIPIN